MQTLVDGLHISSSSLYSRAWHSYVSEKFQTRHAVHETKKEFDERTLQHTFCWKEEYKNNKGNDFWPKKTQLKFNYNWVGFWTLVHGTYLARWKYWWTFDSLILKDATKFPPIWASCREAGSCRQIVVFRKSVSKRHTHGGNYPALMGRLLYSMDRKIKWKSSTACSDERRGLRLSLEHYQTC